MINEMGTLFGGLGGLFVGIAALLPYILKLLKRKPKKDEGVMKRVRRLTLVAGLVLFTLSIIAFAVRSSIGQEKSLNAQFTTEAWDAFNKGDYQNAIIYADKCIDEYRPNADREETQLENSRAPIPPKGRATGAEKNAIWARALLNDVATCYYIKGRSFENLGQKDKAAAYKAASKYIYGRCWDPKGWFWSPSEVASDRLASL